MLPDILKVPVKVTDDDARFVPSPGADASTKSLSPSISSYIKVDFATLPQVGELIGLIKESNPEFTFDLKIVDSLRDYNYGMRKIVYMQSDSPTSPRLYGVIGSATHPDKGTVNITFMAGELIYEHYIRQTTSDLEFGDRPILWQEPENPAYWHFQWGK